MNIKMYTKNQCVWCDRAKALLGEHDLEYLEVDLSDDVKRQEFYQEVGENVATVPQVYINEKRIGGYQELVKWFTTNGKE